MIELLVDTHLHVPLDRLDQTQRTSLERLLTIKNPDKERAAREHVRGWNRMSDTIELWSVSDGTMLVPRGVADKMEEVLGEDIRWDDQRAQAHLSDTSVWSPVRTRDYQEIAVAEALSFEQGVYQAPAGSGKTVTALEIIRRAGRRALVIVNKTNIAEQWRMRSRDHLGFIPGLLGDDIWDETGLFDIALQQTLWARRDSLGDWWSNYGLVLLDECHQVPAMTLFDIIQRFPAYLRLGVSATPGKQVGREHLVRCALGPTFHQTDRKTLVRAGVIRDPKVQVVQTGFTFNFWPTHRAVRDEGTRHLVCDKPGCDRKGLTHRNNWTELVKALCEDDERNELIALDIAACLAEGRAIIVLSRRLKHLDAIARRVAAIVGSSENLFRFSGKEKTAVRLEIEERAEHGSIVIFSTIGDEALDIPRLDTAVLAYPSKNEGLIEQQIGRVARVHPNKLDPLVIDYSDDVAVLRTQQRSRTRVYRRQELEVAA